MSDPNLTPQSPPDPAPQPYAGAMPPPMPSHDAHAAPELPEFIASPRLPPPPPPAPAQHTAPAFEMPSPHSATLDYQFPSTRPAGSQWATDDRAYGGCMVYALLVLTLIGAVIGAIWWIISMVFTGIG